MVVLLRQKFTYSVLCFESDIKSSVFEKFNNEFCYFTDICKFGPFGFV